MPEKDDLEKYRYAFDLVLNEGSVLWNSSSAFLIANSILVAVLASILTEKVTTPLLAIDAVWYLRGVSLVGFIICTLWLFSYNRRSDYYKFRMEQAKEVEPKDWQLFKGIGEKYTNGEIVHVNGAHRQLGILSRIRPRILINCFIFIFLFIYGFLFLGSFFLKI